MRNLGRSAASAFGDNIDGKIVEAMDQKKSRTIWGMNPFAAIAIGLVAISVLLFIGYQMFRYITRTRNVSSVVNVDPSVPIQSQWTFGRFEPIDKTNYLSAPVHSTQNYEMSYYSKDASAVRNYLFVSATDQSTRWLVPTNNYLFLSTQQLREKESYDDMIHPDKMRNAQVTRNDKPVKWMRYEVVKADTNGDQRLTEKDRSTIAVSSVTGEGYTEVIQNVDGTLGSMMRDENTLIFFYKSDGKYFVAEINLPQRQVTTIKELPKFLSQ